MGYWTSVRRGGLKLIHVPDRDGHTYELYDLEADPGETRNLYRSGTPRIGGSRTRLETALAAWRARLLEPVDDASAALEGIDPRELERLRALGYVN